MFMQYSAAIKREGDQKRKANFIFIYESKAIRFKFNTHI